MFRANTRLARLIGNDGCEFIRFCAEAIQRILPHVEIEEWKQIAWRGTESVWLDSKRRKIRITIAIGNQNEPGAASMQTTVARRQVGVAGQVAGQTLDSREYDICKIVSEQIEEVQKVGLKNLPKNILMPLRQAFDEEVVAKHIERHHRITLSVSELFSAFHSLSEQTYENKSLALGCLIDPKKKASTAKAKFPSDYLNTKKNTRRSPMDLGQRTTSPAMGTL